MSQQNEIDKRGLMWLIGLGAVIGSVSSQFFGDNDGGGEGGDSPEPTEIEGEELNIDETGPGKESAWCTGFEDGERCRFTTAETTANGSETPEIRVEFDTEASGSGELTADGTAVCRTEWTPEESGRYQATAVYTGNGSFEVDTVGDTESNAGIISTIEVQEAGEAGEQLAVESTVDAGIGEEQQLEKVARDVVRFAATTLTTKRLGPLAGFIVNELTEFLESDWGINLNETIEDGFNTGAESETVSVTFEAEAGERVWIQFAPVVFLSSSVKTDETFTGSVETIHELQQINVEER